MRPGRDGLMADCRKGIVDVVVVWKFDRFGRSLRHLVTALAEFKSLGIDFVSATEGVDTTSPAGELVFQIFGAIAQFERSLIVERVPSGISSSQARWETFGPTCKKKTQRQRNRHNSFRTLERGHPAGFIKKVWRHAVERSSGR